jgi:phage tail-like protein
MRTTIPGLPSSLPISDLLPGVFIEHDPVLVAFTTGLDDTLAPIPGVIDSLAAYIDPKLAPADFLEWLATWVGIEVDEAWPVERKREAVVQAVEIYQHLGTEAGLRRYLELVTGGQVRIRENGGIAVSDPSEIDLPALDRIVARAKPAWVAHRVQVVTL